MNKKFYLHVDQRHCETQELCGLCRCNFPSNSMYTEGNTGKKLSASVFSKAKTKRSKGM